MIAHDDDDDDDDDDEGYCVCGFELCMSERDCVCV